jgi:propionyl-CoA carboxylase alpha chain
MNRLLSRSGTRSFTSIGKYPKTFDKVLIANRGEISRRVQRTCKKMGIKTVAIYSDADRHAMFVREADEAFRLGPPPSGQSYLRADLILQITKQCGAQGLHPGYGFLSENSKFAKLLADNGITFIGPPHYAINAMGDKIESKKLAKKSGVNMIPGFLGEVDTPEKAKEIANQIGYPVMVKASAGGGGKGMRIAWNDKECELGFRLSREEAISSFGDGRLLIEKYVETPRHIEFQILGDQQGHYLYLPERECSVQRRNQKVIEEAPSVVMDPKTRHAMGSQACMMAKACGYYTTGTCEFLMDKHKKFYFLEMNTRLQVEHPVTEMITGVDLVEQMILTASGHPLPITQDDIKINGHSAEYRIYAEDCSRKFLPSIGFLEKYREPITREGLRIDTGVEEGSEISMYYDPMISKCICWGKDRKEALFRLNNALEEYVIKGVIHNSGFGKSIINNETFIAGDYSTAFIPKFYKDGFKGEIMSAADHKFLSIVAFKMAHNVDKQNKLKGVEYPAFNAALNPLYCTIDGKTFKVVQNVATGAFSVTTIGSAEEKTDFDNSKFAKFNMHGDALIKSTSVSEANNASTDKTIQFMEVKNGNKFQFYYRGSYVSVDVFNQDQFELKKYMAEIKPRDTAKLILSPMPGAVVSVNVVPGQVVVDGQEICVIEAMKMQNLIRSEKEAKVKSVKVKKGQSVAVDEVLIEFE